MSRTLITTGTAGQASPERGITLVEMMVVVGVLTLMAGIVFPAVTSGIDSIRLSSSAGDVATFLNGALNRAERRQQPVVISIFPMERKLLLETGEPGFSRTLELPEAIRIEAVHPSPPVETLAPRRFLVLPGGVIPRIQVELGTRKGGRKLVSVDPVTGVPEIRQGGIQ